MRKLLSLSTLMFAVVSFANIAGEKIDKSLAVDGATNISIENLRGKVKVIGWDKKQVSVTGELDDEAEEFEFEHDGSYINIKVKMPHNMHNFNNSGGSNLTIKVPSNLRVDFTGVSSNVTLSKLYKSTEVKTVSGNIDINDAREHIELTSVSGDINSRKLDGKIYMTTVSGNIDDQNSNGRIKLKAVSGDLVTHSKADEVALGTVSGEIEFTLASVDEIKLSTVSGDVDGSLSLNKNGLLKASSVSGDIEVKFNNDVQASFRLKSNAGGNLVNRITSDKAQHAKYGPSSKLYFETGNAKASVKGSTVSGTIKVSN